MKSRFGFVSNSSSSSFVLPVDYYGNISEVSKGMLDVVIEDYEGWSGIKKCNKKHSRLHSTWIKNLNKALKKKSVKSGKIGIVMSSCNYDTYIIKRDDKLYISTSNNHDWKFFDGAINYEYVSPDDNNAVANELESIIEGEMFFDIRDETTHSNEKWCDSNESKMTCPTCKKTVFGYIINKNGEKICNNCRKGDLGKTPEKATEKLMEKNKKNQNITSHMSLEE